MNYIPNYDVIYDHIVTNEIYPEFTKTEDLDLKSPRKIHSFVSIENRRKLERNGFELIINDHPKCFTSIFLLSHFSKYLISDDMILVPFGCVTNALKTDEFFLKPNSGNKLFPGQAVKTSKIELLRKTYKIQDDDLVARSSVEKILSEKRCYLNIPERKLITSSYYNHHDTVSIPFDASEIIASLFADPNIDLLPDVIVADIALIRKNDKNFLKLIEFNSVNTSGLYSCDIHEIIQSIESLT